MLTALRDILGLEIGSINVPDPNNPGRTLTYARAVLQPTFTLGKVKTALYLPIIYQGDMFNMSDWYQPGRQRRVELRTETRSASGTRSRTSHAISC